MPITMTRQEAESRVDALAVDSVVAAAFLAHGHNVRETILEIILKDAENGIDTIKDQVDVDLGLMWPDGNMRHGTDWSPSGRYSIRKSGVRSFCLSVGDNVHWTGPADKIGRGWKADGRYAKLTIIGTTLSHACQIECPGRPLTDLISHPWLQSGHIVRSCRIDEQRMRTMIEVEEVMIPIREIPVRGGK